MARRSSGATAAPRPKGASRAARAAARRAVGEPTIGRIGSVSGRDRWWWLAGDTLALLALSALVSLVWLPAFGTRWVFMAALGGTLLGAGIGALAVLRRWGPLATLAASFAALLVFGTILTAPGRGIGHMVPTPRLLADLAAAPVTVWRGMLTLTPPLGETGVLLAAPMMVAMLAASTGVVISARSGRSWTAWLPSAAALVVAGIFGTGVVRWPVLVGVGFLAVVLVWTTWRRRVLQASLITNASKFDWRSALGGAVVLAVAAGVAFALQPAVAPAHRVHLRERVQPPLDTHQWGSPLQGFRRNVVDDKDLVLFSVEGLPANARIRLATMDSYDGFVAGVANSSVGADDSGSFRRIGAQVPGDVVGQQADVVVKVEGLRDVWVPTVGQLRSVTSPGQRGQAIVDNLYYNPASGTGVVTTGVARGDEYRLAVTVPATPSQGQIRTARASALQLPPMDPTPAAVRDLAVLWTREATGQGDMALKLEEAFRKGYYSNGQKDEQPSLPGHSVERLATLLATDRPMVGDEEQYAVAMALMARVLGLPSRVVYGYAPGKGGAVAVNGSMATAWVEINFLDLGWVAFNPTPPRDRTTDLNKIENRTKPRPQVENPPPPPQRPEEAPPEGNTPLKTKGEEQKGNGIDLETVGRIALYGGLPLLLVVAPIAFVLGTKMRRRRRRQFAADPARRVAGGWDELMDRARDLGARPPAGDTRSEQAVFLADHFERLGDSADAAVLAREADASVFAPEGTSEAAAAAYWGRVRGAVRGLAASRSWWRRLRAALSIASLRRPR